MIIQIIFLLFSFLCNTYPVDAVPIDDSQSLEMLYASHNVEISIMYGLDLIVLQLGSLCTLYVIIRTFVRWFKHGLSLHMSHKLPFYIALSDFFVYVVLTVDLYYPAINGKLWTEKSCKIIGLSFYYFAIFNMILVGSLALVSYCRVCRAMKVDTGILDYKLFIFPTLVPIILSIPAWRYLGDNGYWCFRDKTSSSTFVPLVLVYMDIIILMTSLFCYIGIAHAINVSRFSNDQEIFHTSNKKIIGYLFMYILQWSPVIVYIMIDIWQSANMWIFAICIISLPAGEIINVYRYISNEGWWDRDSESDYGNDSSPRRSQTDNLHSSINNYGGPPTISQWRELESQDQIVIQSQPSLKGSLSGNPAESQLDIEVETN